MQNYTPVSRFHLMIPGLYSCCSLFVIFYFRQVITKLISTPSVFGRHVFVTKTTAARLAWNGDGEPFVGADKAGV